MKILLLGYGVMGHTVEELATDTGHVIAGHVDADDPPVSPEQVDADVAIEFAGPEGAPSRIRQAVAAGIPVVSGSTGWDDRMDEVRRAVETAGGALLHAPNLSIGVAVFERIVRRAARLLDVVPDYRLELDETHHTRKVDHPSGTARWLAEGVVERVSRLDGWTAKLMSSSETPSTSGTEEGRLPVRSWREGDVAGTHVLRASGPDDVIELTHRARTRDGFARGAIRAAEWLHGRRGVYTLDDMLDDLLTPTDSDLP